MEIHSTNKNFGQDYRKIKEAFMRAPVLRQKVKDPIKEWQTWIDLDNESLRDLTNYLLSELVFNEPLTSITKIIPLVENNDLMVGISLYLDKEAMYATNTTKEYPAPLFISTEDLVNMLNELINEEDGPSGFLIKEFCYKLAYKLRIVHELNKRRE